MIIPKELILIGGGGHCKSVIDVIEAIDRYKVAGILDVKEKIGSFVSGYKIIGSDSDIEFWKKKQVEFLITIGQIGNAALRIKSYNSLIESNAIIAKVISPNALISKNSTIGNGSIIMHHVLVNAGVWIGNNCILNTKALIEHDVIIGDNCHISTAAVINGGCKIGKNCFIGSNSVLIQGIEIGDNCVIGAGSVLTKSILPNSKIVGNPGRIL